PRPRHESPQRTQRTQNRPLPGNGDSPPERTGFDGAAFRACVVFALFAFFRGSLHFVYAESMKTIFLPLLFGLLLPSFAAETPPVISVRLHASRPGAAGKNPGLLLAAWNDGRVVWSSDRAEGGGPAITP